MKYNTFFYCLSAILFITVFQSCKKEHLDIEEDQTPQYALAFTRHALEYVNVGEGKYFIYKDSATAQIDSVIATTCKLENIFNGAVPYTDLTFLGLGIVYPVPAYSHESFRLTLTKFDGSSQTAWFDAQADLELSASPQLTSSCDTADMSLEFVYSFGYPGRQAFYLTHPMTADTAVIVEGTQYNNVVIVSGHSTYPPSSQEYNKTTYYWAKGSGIIKYQLIEGQSHKTYTLLRHN